MLVLPIPVTVLGLGGWGILSFVISSWLGLLRREETTPWVTFDAARPVVDATAFGISGKPFFGDGSTVSFKVNPKCREIICC